jgi:hypothetical protein
MRSKVLWIEDGAEFECAELTGPVYNSRKYDLQIALTVTDAISRLQETEFAVVVVDIRMDPGDSPEWRDRFEKGGADRGDARLGIQLLYSLFKPQTEGCVRIDPLPGWLKPKRIGVLTVESEKEIGSHLEELGIKCYRRKQWPMPPTALLEVIDRVLEIQHLGAGNT